MRIFSKLHCLFGAVFFYISGGLYAQPVEYQLFELPDVIFEALEAEGEDARQTYQLYIRQPLDHHHPSKGHFYQKAYLSHRNIQRPVVIVTEGYNCRRNRISEVASLLDANQIQVEHRFFGESLPDSIDYQYLKLEQATADLHHIRQLFAKIYTGKWISTGISKGGATTIFYRYFFPNDVAVSIPYVAPINRAFEEPRIYDFLDTIGTAGCRQRIESLQRRLLQKREEVLPLLAFYSKGAKHKYTYLSLEEAFEFTILEYPFSFWQYGHSCDAIPSVSSSLYEAVEYIIDVSDIGFFSDQSMERYASHYYQSAKEMGYYGYETGNFDGLLKALPMQPHPHAAFVPGKVPVSYDGALLEKINAWLPKHANQFIYINGALDTWSASAVPPSEEVDALWFFMAGKHHGNARIRNMTEREFSQLVAALEKWLSVPIDPSRLSRN